MNSMQLVWKNVRAVAKFMWRHFFTLVNLWIGFSVFIKTGGQLNWKNGFYMTVACVLLDWAKKFIKFKHSCNKTCECHNPYFGPHWTPPSQDIRTPLHIRQWWNPSVSGTVSYASDNYPRVKHY